MSIWQQKGALALVACAMGPWAQAEVVSFAFADVIKSNGAGHIDLFKPANKALEISAATLEAFRQDGAGELIFAVDVNEAASGSEKAQTQGVAVESIRLMVTIEGETHSYTGFRSQTRSILQPAGASSRAVYSTLLGNAGSNRVSSDAQSAINNSSFDATLRVPVDRDLSRASAISLTVTLLSTDTALGDPEAFYDYSNGYEMIALVSAADADYLDHLASGHEGAPLVLLADGASAGLSWLYYPSAQSHYVVSYEDLYPQRGDYDFNDLVVAYQVAVGVGENGAVQRIEGKGFLVARGAEYDHQWHLRIPMPAHASGMASLSLYAAGSETPLPGFPVSSAVNGNIDLALFESVRSIFRDGDSTYVNTFVEQSIVKGPRFEFAVALDTPIAREAIGAAPFDPYIYVHDTGYEVHMVGHSPVLPYSNNQASGQTGFRDDQGFPFAILIPDEWQPPLAAVDIGMAYPDFMNFVESSGTVANDWYRQPQTDRVKSIRFREW